jgi:hypothetical protein
MVLQRPAAIILYIFYNSLFFCYLPVLGRFQFLYFCASCPWHPTCLLLHRAAVNTKRSSVDEN